MSDAPPPIDMPLALRRALDVHRPGLADELEAKVRALPRPCAYVRSRRVASHPLRRSALAKLFGAKSAAPVLPVTSSKFGGLPYAESAEPWDDWHFLGQIDLTEAATLLPELPVGGLVRLDLSLGARDTVLRAKWFPEPSASKAVAVDGIACVGAWETRLELRRGWSLPYNDRDWFALLPKDDRNLRGLWAGWERAGYDEDGHDECHALWGWPAGGLDEPYDFAPPKGAPVDIADYEMLLRITYDNEADFAWGTNWIYVLVPRADFQRGDLTRLVVTAANS